MALTLRQRESVIGVNTMLTLPLTFLSAAFLPLALAPDWIETAATYNPINWAIEAGREALLASPDWSFVLPRVGGLAVVALALRRARHAAPSAAISARPSPRRADDLDHRAVGRTDVAPRRALVRSTSVISSRPRASNRARVASTSSTRRPTTGPGREEGVVRIGVGVDVELGVGSRAGTRSRPAPRE